MKTILFVLDYYLPHKWWVENVFENIILRLLKKWYRVIVLTSHYDNKLKKHEKEENLEIYRTGKSRFWFMFSAISLGTKILKNNNIDLIHASTYWWAIPARILAKKFGKKVLLTVHEIFWNLWFKYKWLFFWLFYKFFEYIIFKLKYDFYHCVSKNTAKDIVKKYWIKEEKMKIIYNWIDKDFWSLKNVSGKEIFEWRKKYWWDESFVFLYFWHAGKSKWIDNLIGELSEILKIDWIKIIFNVIESKRSNKILNKLEKIKDKKLQVFEWFKKNDLRKLVASCDCVIAPSISEWFGSVHTESVSMWKILITTKNTAIPEVVWWNVRFLQWWKKWEILEACKDVIEWKHEKIPEKNFSWEDNVDSITKIYEELLR